MAPFKADKMPSRLHSLYVRCMLTIRLAGLR